MKSSASYIDGVPSNYGSSNKVKVDQKALDEVILLLLITLLHYNEFQYVVFSRTELATCFHIRLPCMLTQVDCETA